ncbi:MAG TPA: class IV adenylate cyclase [Acidobacteriota bacterium]|jgi:adenylate cyclase class 2
MREVEIKLPVCNLKEFLEKLGRLRPRRVAERKFEDNSVLDLPKLRLRENGLLLRVRNERGKGYLTFKGPPLANSIFKVREELETEVNPAEVLEIFRKLGYKVAFRYQKYRTVYQTRSGSREKSRPRFVKVMIDETPIGNFVELEGDAKSVTRVAESLGYKKKDFIRESYYSLFLSHCRRNGRSARDMVFR